jgi:lipoyl(octanoyl) transferase
VKTRSQLGHDLHSTSSGKPILWQEAEGLTDYKTAVAQMESWVEDIANGGQERLWAVEHPPLYTAGTSTNLDDLVDPDRFPVYKSGRGGQLTYHGPGQLVLYIMLNLKNRKPDIRRFISTLEELIILTLADFDIEGERREDRVGVWVRRPDISPTKEDKIAAIGIRLRKWVTFHGLSINVNPNLEHFNGIIPCGVKEHGITSITELNPQINKEAVTASLKHHAQTVFGCIG